MKKSFSILFISIITILFLGIFISSKENYSKVNREDVLKYINSDLITVSNFNNSILVKPKEREAMVGYIFYPQNNVDENSYIPVMAEIAQRGFNVYIMKTPLHLNLNTNKLGEQIIYCNQQIQKWIVSGVEEGEKSAEDFYNRIKKNKDIQLVLCGNTVLNSNIEDYYCNRYHKEDILKNSKELIKMLTELKE